MSDNNTTVKIGGGGGSILGLTFVVLLVLKLTNLAQITWFWVFFPLWIGPAIILGILAVIGLGVGCFFAGALLLDKIRDWRRK